MVSADIWKTNFELNNKLIIKYFSDGIYKKKM